MIWNCPHCSTPVSLRINAQDLKHVMVKCAACSGIVALSRSTQIPKLLHELPSELAEDARTVTEIAEISKESQEHEADLIAKSVKEAEAMLQADPLVTESFIASDRSPALSSRDELAISHEGPTLQTAPSSVTGNPILKSQTLFEEASVEISSLTPSLSSLGPSIRIVGVSNLIDEVPEIPKPFPPIPKAPDFLTHENPDPQSQAAIKKASASNLPIILATIIAIASGIYLFIEGQKILKETQRSTAPSITLSPPAA